MATWLLLLPLAVSAAASWIQSGRIATYLLRNCLLSYPFELVLYLVYYHFIHRYFFSSLRNLPYPEDRSFLLGHVKRLLAEPFGVPNLDWDAQMPGLYRVFLGPTDLLVPSGPTALATIFGKDSVFEKPKSVREGLVSIIGHSLVSSEGEQHKAHRRVMNPVFRNIRNMVPSFWTKATIMSNEIRQMILMANQKSLVVDISNITMKTAFGVIMSTTFGLDIEQHPEKEAELLTAWKHALLHGETQTPLEAFYEGVLPLFVSPKYTAWLLDHTPRNKRSLRGREVIKQFSLEQIAAAKSAKASGKTDTDSPSILAKMIDAGITNEQELLDHLKTLLSAGHETTTTSLDWAIMQLCRRTDIQDRLRGEILSVVGPNADLTATTMDSMPLLHGFVMEILRLHPTIPMTVRVASRDTMVDGTQIAKGTPVFVPIQSINRNKSIWGPDANEINLQRWPDMATSPGTKNYYNFLTFIVGSRVCIGKEYAIRSIKADLVALIRNFKLHEAHPGKIYLPKKSFVANVDGDLTARLELIG